MHAPTRLILAPCTARPRRNLATAGASRQAQARRAGLDRPCARRIDVCTARDKNGLGRNKDWAI